MPDADLFQKKKRAMNTLDPLQKFELIKELKDPKTQADIDQHRYHLTQYAAVLSERLKFTITRGNLYELAHKLGLKFHHPLTGVLPHVNGKPGEKTVLQRLAELELKVAFLTSALAPILPPASA